MPTIVRVSDLEHLVDAAARRFVEVVASIQASGGGVHGDGIARVVLTGGTAGIGVLARLRALDEAARRPVAADAQSAASAASSAVGAERPAAIDWARVHVFFGDERNVPVAHPESNEGQAREALLDHVDLPAENLHSYGIGERDLGEVAVDYRGVIERFAPRGFDLHLLGMGPEGHINTLFPHTAAVAESEELVVAEFASPKPPAERATLTLPAIARAERVWMLVSGSGKAEAAAEVVAGADARDWPAAGAHGAKETLLFVDEDAASLLPPA